MFREDLEGLRAVAVVLVVAFHARLGGVPGGFVGVDVFFVLSGYLITRLLVRELDATGTISLRGFYARRARRLLPLACLVLVATAVGASVLLPPLDRAGIAADIRAAALYYANWSFASSATEYMADLQVNPVLHYWSLGVEEQFYVVWPVVLVVAAHLAGTEDRARQRRAAVLAIGAVGAITLALSVATTSSSGPWAYFGLHTRAWEMAIGGGLAFVRLDRIPGRAAVALGAVGLGSIVGSAILIDEATPFPGIAALAPCLGAAGIIASHGRGVGRLLGHPLPRYVGRISYAWYLWHWPCLLLGARQLPMPAALAVSFALAVASHHLVETPVRTSRWLAASPGRSLALAALLTLAAVLAGTSLPLLGTLTAEPELMTAYRARLDQPRGLERCYAGFDSSTAAEDCTFGDRSATRAVALIGDSHAHAWFPAIDRWAKARGLRLHVWTKLACPITDVPVWLREARRPYTACAAWRAQVLERLRAVDALELVIVARSHWYSALLEVDGARGPEAEAEPRWRAGTERTLAALAPLARRIVLLRAVPRAPRDVPACISEQPNDVHACDFHHDPETWNDRHIERAEASAAAAAPGVRFVDMTREICSGDPCAVFSSAGSIKFRDHHHLAATFAASLSPALGAKLDAALE